MGQHAYLVPAGIAPGPHRGGTSHANPVSLEDRGNRADVTGTTHREAKVVSARTITSGSPDPAPGAQGKSAFVACDVDNVRKDGTGTGQRTRALAGKKHLANRVSANQYSIILVANTGQLMRHGQQYRSAAERYSILAQFRGRDMLNHETQFPGRLHVLRGNVADPFNLNGVGVQLPAERQFGQDFQLLRRVVAIDIERRIGFRKALGLRLAKRFLELDPILGHAGKNVIAGTVQNAAQLLNIISNQTVPQSADNRNAAANAGFE